MPRYVVEVKAYGWFELTAEDLDEAIHDAYELCDGSVPIGVDWDEAEVQSVTKQDDD